MTAAVPPPAWTEDALCAQVGGDLWFQDEPGMGYYAQVEAARKICAVCPVREICQAVGAAESYGVWGGITEQERAGQDAPSPRRLKAECPKGHARTPENLYGNGCCRICQKERDRLKRDRLKGVAA